jgi:hypothetical protein
MPPDPELALLDLDDALRRTVTELDACAHLRRHGVERVRDRWWGIRRNAFDEASEALECRGRRADEELRALRKAVRALTDGIVK